MGLELERSREWCGRVYPTTRVIRLQTRKCRPLRPSSASTSQPVRAPAESFLRSLALVREATTFGGVHSTAERRARWGGDAISEGSIRFSVGCGSVEDILSDVAGALRQAAP